MLTCFGVGSLVARVLLAAWGGPMRRMNGILGSMILAGVGGVITGISESLVVTAAGVFIIGASFVFAIGLNRVIWQVKAAAEVLGRVFALRVLIGVVAQSTGIILAGLTLATFAILSFVVRPIWRLEDALPDQPPQVDSESDSEQEADESARMAEEGRADDATGC
ncbi:MAG: hypothetical protein OXN86_12225 [Chloroflexota bacterium]|nr:hypothetical protein [Chloroflexota bacterium]